MKYDRMRVERLISAWRSASFHLQRLARVPSSESIRDADKIASAKYNFMAIESATDVAQHLIAKNKMRMSEDYVDTSLFSGKPALFLRNHCPVSGRWRDSGTGWFTSIGL